MFRPSGGVDDANIGHLLDEFYAACDDVGATQKQKLQACTWIIAREARETQDGMTNGLHVVDVLTRVLEDLAKTLRGVLARYGHANTPQR